MTRKLLSLLSRLNGKFSPVTIHHNSISYLRYSVYYNSSQNVKPIHMAYTAYEKISKESENAPPILVLHGLLGSKMNWNYMGRQLASSTLRKVITLDLRNHGDSPHSKEFSYDHVMADIKQIMSEMEIKEASLIGHSIGGRAMMAFALTHPDLVVDLIAVDISPVSISKDVHKVPPLLTALKNIKLSSPDLTLLKARDEADRQLRITVNDKRVRSFLLTNLAYDDHKQKFYWKINIPTLIQKLHTFFDFPFNSRFDKRALFIAGGKSDFLKKDDEPLILKKFPKAKFKYIQDAGHTLHVEKPKEFLNIVTEFLSRDKVSVNKQ